MLPPIRRLFVPGHSGTPGSGPPGEGVLARVMRRRRDHARLAGLDDRLLRDIGLRREISRAGITYGPLSPRDPGGDRRPAGQPWDGPGRARAAVASSAHGRAALDRP
ncbi:DUF1127 domain-containing protein [Methylobacterium aquaticum]|uniref:DUF1127 domain-containing protein n=1 Tax=Methylobacterium aquaticum TaxID=270351 RepID=UPI003D17D62E